MKQLNPGFRLQPAKARLGKLSAAVIVALAASGGAHAVEFDSENFDVRLDTTVTAGASWRMEDQDDDLIGKSNLYQIETGRSITELYGSGIVPPGAWSNNNDDGNLNFDKGDTFSRILKVVSELDIRQKNGDYGFFARGLGFYDFELMDGDREFRELSDRAIEDQGRDIRLLDSYGWANFDIGDRQAQVRLGNQVINWGESTFIQHSISEANPVDLRILRAPGAELREAFIPVLQGWASVDLSDSLSLEGFYQFEWEGVQVDQPGTYFATRDFLGDGSEGKVVHLGFSQFPEGTPGTVAVRTPDREVDDNGQYGVKLAWFSEGLDTEFGFYYMNYHSRRPIISARAHNGVQVEGFLEFPEDIKLYGVSFNTATDSGISIAGEVSYRKDEPLQIDDVELLFATLEPVGTIPSGTSQIPGGAALGEEISGYRLFDTWQGQVTFTNLFGPTLGASQFLALLEIGANYIEDMPGKDELRFESEGTYRSGNPARAGMGNFVLAAPGTTPCGFTHPVTGTRVTTECEGFVDSDGFADDFSWGYRLVGRLEYNNAFAGINVLPRIVFQHDVKGNTPAPISNFLEDRKSMALGVTFDYQARWKADVVYNVFWDAEPYNLVSDRDYLAMSVSYSF